MTEDAAAVAVSTKQIDDLIKRLDALQAQLESPDSETLKKLLPIVKKRIFTDGKDANDGAIGSYKKSYIRKRVRKGLGANRKVILQFTRAMASDFSVVEGGLGFPNEENNIKADHVQAHFKKDVWNLTKKEQEFVSKTLQQQWQKRS